MLAVLKQSGNYLLQTWYVKPNTYYRVYQIKLWPKLIDFIRYS